VDCADVSTTSDVAVVMALLFGHWDDEERVVGNPGVGGASAKASPRSCLGVLTQSQWAIHRIGSG
jgi:hypothetical protein